MDQKLSFDKMCRIGLEKRQQCVVTACPHRRHIAFNKCWDCEHYLQQPPVPKEETLAERRDREQKEWQARINPIPMITKEPGCTIITIPHTTEKGGEPHTLGPKQSLLELEPGREHSDHSEGGGHHRTTGARATEPHLVGGREGSSSNQIKGGDVDTQGKPRRASSKSGLMTTGRELEGVSKKPNKWMGQEEYVSLTPDERKKLNETHEVFLI